MVVVFGEVGVDFVGKEDILDGSIEEGDELQWTRGLQKRVMAFIESNRGEWERR